MISNTVYVPPENELNSISTQQNGLLEPDDGSVAVTVNRSLSNSGTTNVNHSESTFSHSSSSKPSQVSTLNLTTSPLTSTLTKAIPVTTTPASTKECILEENTETTSSTLNPIMTTSLTTKGDSSTGNHTQPVNRVNHSSSVCKIDSARNHKNAVDDYSCGLCSFKPKYLQPCANKKTFLAVFCLTSVLQGMFYTYFVSVLTTIEKLYQVQSKATGFIMSATEMGQISGVLFLTYYGGQGNRPKWIACGMIVFALAALLAASPHYFFDDLARKQFSPHPVIDFSQSFHLDKKNIGLLFVKNQLCSVSKFNDDLNQNSSAFLNSSSGTNESQCASEENTNKANRLTNSVLAIFFISLLFIGIGSTTTNTLGIPYIDDNVAPKDSPLYFGITIGVKIFGPVIGFLLGSVCTNIHIDFPFGESSIENPSDPQWIGAWWLGMIFVFLTLSFASIFMMAFPKKLSKVNDYNDKRKDTSDEDQQMVATSTTDAESHRANLKDFPSTLRRLLKNDVLLLRIASSVLHLLPIAGIYTFLPKYLESQFQLTASQASAVTGIAGILVMGFGIFASSFFIGRYKPSPKFVALWIAAAALIYSIGMVILMGLGCPMNEFIGYNSNGPDKSCWKDCSCSGHFAPICTSQKTTYLSPCIAGCTKVTRNSSSYTYSNCGCLDLNVTATSGYCPLECSNLIWYIVIFATIVLVHSTCEVGSMLLTLRCVEPHDKAMALGLVSFSIGLFGNVPCPILYGTVVDSACLFWEENCGKLGACRIYDSFKFRTTFHGLTAFIMFIACLVDIFVWYRASSIDFGHEIEVQQNEDETKVKLQSPNASDDKSTNVPNDEDEDEEDEEEDFVKEDKNSNGTRSSELKPLNVVKVDINADDMV
uniref:Solute carrier organic anion transporter family member n=1 Tax=Tetranychus urticae TaxID=32264 RepID=T1KRH4_TETUR